MTNEDIIQHFKKQPDGAWLCLADTVIETPAGPLRIEPGSRFAFGDTQTGFDLAEYLERLGAQFGS
jgi:hypothetical protein